jgi:hypothetical protein
MLHRAEAQLPAMGHSMELRLCTLPQSTEFLGKAWSQNKIISAFTEAVQVTVYQ